MGSPPWRCPNPCGRGPGHLALEGAGTGGPERPRSASSLSHLWEPPLHLAVMAARGQLMLHWGWEVLSMWPTSRSGRQRRGSPHGAASWGDGVGLCLNMRPGVRGSPVFWRRCLGKKNKKLKKKKKRRNGTWDFSSHAVAVATLEKAMA